MNESQSIKELTDASSHVHGEGGKYDGVSNRGHVQEYIRCDLGIKAGGMGHSCDSEMFSLKDNL